MDISIFYNDYTIYLSVKQSNTICLCSIKVKNAVPDYEVYDLLSILKRNKISNGIDYENLKMCCDHIRRGESVSSIVIAQGRLPVYTRKSVQLKINEVVKATTSNRTYYGRVKAGQVLATWNDGRNDLDGFTLGGDLLSASHYFQRMAGKGVAVDLERKEYRATCDGHAYMQSNVLTVKQDHEVTSQTKQRNQTDFLFLLSDFVDQKALLN